MILETEQLLKEIDRAKARLEKAPIVDQKKEFLTNVYPLMRIIAETCGGRLDEQENALENLLGSSEPIITPELSVRMIATYRMGMELALDLLKDTPPTSEELSAKARAFHEAATIMIELVEEFTIEIVEDDDDDEDLGEDDDDEATAPVGEAAETEVIDLREPAGDDDEPEPAPVEPEADDAPEEISI